MAELSMHELSGRPAEVAAVQRLLEEAPEYHFRVYGRPADPQAATRLFADLPAGRTFADKFLFGLRLDDQMIGVIGLVRGHPLPETVLVEPFLLAESWQHRGWGTRAMALLLERVQAWPEVRQLRVELPAATRRGGKFLTRVGFRPTGEWVPTPVPDKRAASEVWVRPLAPPAGGPVPGESVPLRA